MASSEQPTACIRPCQARRNYRNQTFWILQWPGRQSNWNRVLSSMQLLRSNLKIYFATDMYCTFISYRFHQIHLYLLWQKQHRIWRLTFLSLIFSYFYQQENTALYAGIICLFILIKWFLLKFVPTKIFEIQNSNIPPILQDEN